LLFIYPNSKRNGFTPEKYYYSKGELVFNYYLYTPEIIGEKNEINSIFEWGNGKT
jgi:hypothetical protein